MMCQKMAWRPSIFGCLRRLTRIPSFSYGSGWWLGIESQVIFHGQVSEARKNELLSRADIHVLPSVKEGRGLAVIEAA